MAHASQPLGVMERDDDIPALGDVPIGPKGAPDDAALPREWTALSPEEEAIRLEETLAMARHAGDACEVERIEARLRMLHAR
jgi:hypothetical protein